MGSWRSFQQTIEVKSQRNIGGISTLVTSVYRAPDMSI